MLSRPRSVATLVFKCAFLFLACAVFSWGLHAKLSLYKTTQSLSPSTPTVAKLLTERRSAQALASIESAVQQNTAREMVAMASFVVAFQAILIPSFQFHLFEVSLGRPCRCDFQSQLTQRPPPAVA